jgi:acetyl esterase/lipase
MSANNCLFPLAVAFFLPISWSVAFGQPPERPGGEGQYLSRQELFKKYDQDGDGQLSQDERRTMRRDIIDGKVNVPPQVREQFRKIEARSGGRPGERPPGKAPGRPGQPSRQRAPENVIVQRDIVYGDAGGRPLKLDLVLPKEKSGTPLPLIVFIHGGGWRGGDKAGGVGRVTPFVASGNYVGATVGYRLSGEAIWPAQIHDCKAAIRWLRAHAEKYNIDPERIGVWGSSAGGHLVNMLGTSGDVEELEGNCGSPDQSSRVSCVVPFCGPANFLAPKKFESGRRPSAVDMLLGGMLEEKQELAKQASPITYVSKDDPPFLVVHGTADGTVPFEQAEMFHQALEQAGVDVTFVKIIGGGHGIGGEEVLERVKSFFEKHLRGQDVEVSAEPIDTPARR